ncbi:MAG TPA: V4R domain-containing protein [Candidatus Bathyarchaeia archaeon]|nr:V4R domain-containing protein [Candidatus Bathyarchaeia archaeon]
MSSLGRYAPNRIRRLISSISSIRFRDEVGEVEYFGQQVVMLRRDAIRLIRDELMRLGEAAGRVIVLRAGLVSGREEGKAILAKAKALGVKSPESLPGPVLTGVEETNMGYGKITIDTINFADWTFKVSVSNSFEIDKSALSRKPVCVFLLGYLRGLFSTLAGKDLGGEEVECRGKGDSLCKFWLSAKGQPEPAMRGSESKSGTIPDGLGL